MKIHDFKRHEISCLKKELKVGEKDRLNYLRERQKNRRSLPELNECDYVPCNRLENKMTKVLTVFDMFTSAAAPLLFKVATFPLRLLHPTQPLPNIQRGNFSSYYVTLQSTLCQFFRS